MNLPEIEIVDDDDGENASPRKQRRFIRYPDPIIKIPQTEIALQQGTTSQHKTETKKQHKDIEYLQETSHRVKNSEINFMDSKWKSIEQKQIECQNDNLDNILNYQEKDEIDNYKIDNKKLEIQDEPKSDENKNKTVLNECQMENNDNVNKNDENKNKFLEMEDSMPNINDNCNNLNSDDDKSDIYKVDKHFIQKTIIKKVLQLNPIITSDLDKSGDEKLRKLDILNKNNDEENVKQNNKNTTSQYVRQEENIQKLSLDDANTDDIINENINMETNDD